MAGEGSGEIEVLLDKLQSCGLSNGRGEPDTARDVVVDISEYLSKDLSPVQYDLCLSVILGEKGVISFGRSVAKEQAFADTKKTTLELIKTLLDKDVKKVTSYVDDVRKYSLFLYNTDKSGKVQTAALEVLCALLDKCGSHVAVEDLNPDQFIERLCIDIRSPKGSTVLHHQLRTLGMLLYCYPENLQHKSPLIFKVLKDQLIKHTGSKPDLNALGGALRGITLYLHHFPQGLDDDQQVFEDLYKHIHKVLNPEINLPRREAQRAALDLFHTHGAKFSSQLYKSYDTLFQWLIKWCDSRNRDDHKAGLRAMDTFIVVIANVLELQSEEHQKKGVQVFKYFLQEYNRLLERSGSTTKLSLAVKGYGLLSGACRQFLSPVEVHTMFSQVLTASQHAFYRSSEMLETKLSNLPSYIESLAIIISNMDVINVGIVESVQQLALALVEHFPLVSMSRHFLAYRAFFKLLYAIYNKSEYLQDFLHSFVYKSIILTCSHAPEVEATPGEDRGAWRSSGGAGSDDKWKGLKNDIITYKNFSPMWNALMSPGKITNLQVTGMPATVMTEIRTLLYNEFISCILEVTEKLDLDTYKQGEQFKEEAGTSDGSDGVATSDPVSGLQAKTPKDFQLYMNLVSLMGEVLPMQCEDQFESHVSRICWFFVRQSSLKPLVSAHYTAITSILVCTRRTAFFKRKGETEVETLIHLITSYVLELLQRCRQFRDQLLASCLTLILHLPMCIVMDIFPQLIPPLQMALHLGVSYLPLAEVCVSALQAWIQQLPQEILQQQLPSVLPLLLPYLRSHETGGEAEVQTRVITVKMSFAKQRRKVDQKKMLESKKVDDTAMKRVQSSIMRLIGNLDPNLSMCVIPQDPNSLAAAAVRWDTIKHIKFATPFEQTKVDVYLDDLLPQVVDLAVNSSDRQTKVAASELLHSIIIVMIGTGVVQGQEARAKYPLAPLYRHVFRAVLQLACDPDQVTRQLFLTLAYQIIHWFTNNRNFENPDTAVLLDAIMEGIVTANDPALRDVSAQCLSEFVKWSRKQCREKDQISRNIKSILKRIFSFCKHPSAFKRLGGSLAWNSIYREIREDSQAVDVWTLELLSHLVTSLDLAQTDDPALGTHEQTRSAIRHVERVIREKKEVFWKKSNNRRVPSGIGNGTMAELLKWLLWQCGRPKALVRHACMELLVSLAPHVQGCASVRDFIMKHIGKSSINDLVDIVEAGGEASLGIKQHPRPGSGNQMVVSVKEVNIFCEALLSALDGYSWLTGHSVVDSGNLLNADESQLFSAVTYFVDHMALVTITEYLNENRGIDMDEIVVTPHELDASTKLKCTVIVRLMDFISVVLQDSPDAGKALSKHCLWSPSLFRVFTQCALNPAKVGFDIRDTEVTKHLPLRLEDLLKVMLRKLPQNVAEEFAQHLKECLQDSKFEMKNLLPSSVTEASGTTMSKHNIEGIEIFQKTGWLSKSSALSKSLATDLVDWMCGTLFMERNSVLSAVSPHPSYLQFLSSVLHLAVTLDTQVQHRLIYWATINDSVTGSSDQQVEKGAHVLDILGQKIIPYLMDACDATLARCIELIKNGRFLAAMNFISVLLNNLIRNSENRRRYSSKMVKGFMYHWPTFVAEANKTSIHQETVVGLLSSLFLIDRDGTIKQTCLQPNSDIVSFYKQILSDPKTDLKAKSKALKLLPFFMTMSSTVSSDIGEALGMLSLNHFPLQSTEFPAGGSRDREYHQALSEILSALELSMSPDLLQFVIKIFCREEKHRYEEALHESLEKFIKNQAAAKQLDTLKILYKMFTDPACSNQSLRYNTMDHILIPILQQVEVVSLITFLVDVIKSVMEGVSLPIYGRAEDQHKVLVTKTGSFAILQVMYSRLPKEKVFAPGSEINESFRPGDTTGKELTKEIFRCSSKVAKGELRFDQTHEELRRLCACAAYNALIAVLACVQNDIRFYTNFLFLANPAKGEVLWETLVDIKKSYAFDVEVNFNPGSKKRFVAVRRSLRNTPDTQGGVIDSGTVKYMSSHYLADSSLREDLSQFDFNNSVVLAMSQREDSAERLMKEKDLGGEMTTLNLDQSDFNAHEVMANLTVVIHHMVDAKIMDLHQGDNAPAASDVPKWMTLLKERLETQGTPCNVKLFLLRLMMNTSQVFAPYAAHFVTPILTCLVDGTLGEGINYFFSDLMVMVMGWGKRGIPEDSIMGRNIVARVLRHLCISTPHTRADVFKYNLDVVRSVVECWKKLLTVPYSEIYALMEVKNGEKREVEAGLQLLGIMLANGLPPFTAGVKGEYLRCTTNLLRLMGGHYASVYGAAAEVLGLVLKFQASQAVDYDDKIVLQDQIVKKVTELTIRQQGQAIICVYNIQKYHPAILTRVINRLLNLLPKLYGINRTRVLECLISHSSTMEDVFLHLKEQNLLDILARKESTTQLVSLQLVNAVMPRLTPQQLLYFMPGIITFASHPAAKCRETMYDVLFWIYDNYSDSDNEDGRQLESDARGVLLRAVNEEDAALRQTVLNFWLEGCQSLSLPQRLLHILRKMYSPESEDSFLQTAIYVLLEATRHSADYQRNIFDHALDMCKFREMKVTTAWRARHASMVPLFAESQVDTDSSIASLLSFTQGNDDVSVDGSAGGLGGVQATQANVFSATQQPGATYNWATDSTFDTTLADMEYEATHAPTQGSTAGLLFSIGSSDQKSVLRYKRPGIGNTRMRAHDATDGKDATSNVESKLIRRRFVKDQDREKQSIYFAKMEERRRKLRDKLEVERKSRREAQVTMYRQYRVGELPDIQIPYRALIAPLQALAQRDLKIARLMFELLTQGVMDNAGVLLPHGEEDGWHQQFHEALRSILGNSYVCFPELLRTILNLMVKNDVTADPETLAAACLASRLEALGILVLERQVLLSKKTESKLQPPSRKKARTDVPAVSLDASIWLNMAELYKSLDMWDVVRGIVQSKLGNIKEQTRAALEAESTNNHVDAFVHYHTALSTTDWEEEPAPAEVRVWEEWFTSCAAMLGQWSELENFVEERFLQDNNGRTNLQRVWLLPRPAAAVLPAVVHSKLMNILDGAESDGNLMEFINSAMSEPRHRALLESELPLQLAVLATHQEKLPQAQAYLSTATSTALLTLSQCSLLTPKPLAATVRNIQLITELSDFLSNIKFADREFYPQKVQHTVINWKNHRLNLEDTPLITQCLASYRDLYLHFMEKKLVQEVPEDLPQVIKEAKASTCQSVVRVALQKKNYHLANRYLKKLKYLSDDGHSQARFFFLMTEAHILRGRGKPSSRLQYLVEAWAKFMGKVSSMPILQQNAEIEIQYLKLESSVCHEICEAIHDMGDEWQEENQYMQVLANKFPNVSDKEAWYTELLDCSFNSLKLAANCVEDKQNEGSQKSSKDTYMAMVKYCEDCLENWTTSVNHTEYSKYLITSVLRAMASGSRDAHFHFPRLINVMEGDPSLVQTFMQEYERVPIWMFLLWLSHILIYVDKSPGPALQPIVEKLAAEYPQAVVYPFGISMQQYDFTGSIGKAAKAMCDKVNFLLSQNTLLQQFVSAIALVVVPFIACKDALNSLLQEKDKTKLLDGLKKLEEELLKVGNRSSMGTGSERGEAFARLDRMRKEIGAAFPKSFGENLKKAQSMSVRDILKAIANMKLKIMPSPDDMRKLPRQLKAFSPWLANFQASRYSDVLELPGQYTGMVKPLPEYHIKISSFDENVLPMSSMRVPMRIIIRGDDEKDHKYLVKWGEDLRTDQRMEQMFTLMNSIYASSPLCIQATSRPSLDTYQVVPLSLQVGLLQWVESTQPLKEFINDAYKETESTCYQEAYGLYKKNEHWDLSKKMKKNVVVKSYQEVVNKIPWDAFRREFVKLSSSSEGFFSLRASFAVSYAAMCISHWLLGIGDRHCGNSLINLKTGRVVGIDFGHHFESAVQFLPVPELMPFRLTPQIDNALQPVGVSGMLKDVMVAALGALQESRNILIAVLEAFIKEPTEDWLGFVQRQEGNVEDSKVEIFSKERIKLLKAKLGGINPAHITVWAISQNKFVKKDRAVLEGLREVVLGRRGEDLRADHPKSGLSPHQQVNVMLEQARDPNILGRSWIGWDPFL